MPLRSSDLETRADMEKAMNEIEDLFGAAKDEVSGRRRLVCVCGETNIPLV
jgi:hypothetical protein